MTQEQKIHYTLRMAVAMCFIGHGAFGIITKPVWCNYFAVFGIHQQLAYQLMPWVGSVDILLGIVMIFYPMRIVPAWLVVWGIVTALLRPLSGEPIAELIERAGNYGAPLLLLMLHGGIAKSSLFTPLSPKHIVLNDAQKARMFLVLRIAAFLLLAGHGWLNLIEKKGLTDQYHNLGFSSPSNVAIAAGVFEMVAAISILIKPVRVVVFALLLWKITSELFYPHWEVFEWIERGGSYGVLLALWFAMEWQPSLRRAINHRTSVA